MVLALLQASRVWGPEHLSGSVNLKKGYIRRFIGAISQTLWHRNNSQTIIDVWARVSKMTTNPHETKKSHFPPQLRVVWSLFGLSKITATRPPHRDMLWFIAAARGQWKHEWEAQSVTRVPCDTATHAHRTVLFTPPPPPLTWRLEVRQP